MSGVGEFAQMVADDARLAWHRWRRDTHARALAAAQERHRARVAAWTGHDPDEGT